MDINKPLEGMSIADSRPDLLNEWDYEKNTLSPDAIKVHSNKKARWKCSSCGYEWLAIVNNRSKGEGCPLCANKVTIKGINDLATINPELVKEWNHVKNTQYELEKISSKSKMKVWWICKYGHEWEAAVYSRTVNGTGCPFCANRKVLQGFNDLLTHNPKLAKEWDYERNELKPTDVTANSGKRVWWRCENCGKSWQTSVAHRNSGTGCPHCFARNQTSFPEQVLYYYIKKHWNDAINGYTELFKNHGMELDIYIPSISVGVEYDGYAWHSSEASIKRDINKQNRCNELNIRLIRIKEVKEQTVGSPNDTILISNEPSFEELNECVRQIYTLLNEEISEVDVERDAEEIRSNYITSLIENSLKTKRPDIALEWDVEKNKGILPEMISLGCSDSYWWKCKKGHSWKASPTNRNIFNSQCPYCTRKKVLSGFNDLATTNPELLEFWDFDGNTILPTEIMVGNNTKPIIWKCEKGHRYIKNAYSMLKSKGCPICIGKSVISGDNDVFSIYPNLKDEWNYDRNIDIFPQEVRPGSNRSVWWKCEKGHEWKATIVNRTKGTGCPYCCNRKCLPGYNDLKTLDLKLTEEWDYTKNTEIPENVVYGSAKKYHWICKICGYRWEASVSHRKKGSGCPACAHQVVLMGRSDLKTLYPNIVIEWDYDRNEGLLPEQFLPSSEKEVFWTSQKCGHTWRAKIKYRTKGRGCPYCSGTKVLKGFNDVESQRPDIAKDWDYKKNNPLIPSEVWMLSTKEVWWLCSVCSYEWKSSIRTRKMCPNCKMSKHKK